MQDGREDLTQREASTAPAQHCVQLDVSTEDVETLMSLQDAGLIDLDALEELGAQDPELFATETRIATDFNVYKVAEAIGDEVRTVEKHYLDRARARSQMALEYVPRIRGGEGR